MYQNIGGILSADFQQHGVLLVHLDHQQFLLLQRLHDVAEALEADLLFVEAGIVGLNRRLENRGIDALEAVLLEALQALAEGAVPLPSSSVPAAAVFTPMISEDASVQAFRSGQTRTSCWTKRPNVEQP